ncbi:response regulator transcription factor [Halobacteriovorax sp. GB3]|uniref:LytR/AlgR family response regulator transcription factor n=1 Tax=Halobacteriovorax sp. GB3 TaxID=2719615 RepID=UPI00235F9ECA|nr:response regulator transcription factor [Halobacteriovorax sp. GB3]MDD0853611.1 response regulator transcription factor [Halobacteriovorax sp. GB3]
MRVLIVDDERHARNRLRRLLSEYPLEIVDEASNGKEALLKISQHNPDFIFLDIQMPGLSGLEVAKSIGLGQQKIIFVTAFDHYALEAFDTNVLDYLVKPIESSRLLQTISKMGLEKEGRLEVQFGKTTRLLNLSEVIMFRAEGPYTLVFLRNDIGLVHETISNLSASLSERSFMKINRGEIINLSEVIQVNRIGDRKYEVFLENVDGPLKISRSLINDFKDRMKEMDATFR